MEKDKYPEPTVGAVIINGRGDVLLLKSEKWKNKYVIPGGHIELGETMESALRREIKEETGLDIFDIEYIDLQEYIYENTFWNQKHFIFINFCCKTNTLEVRLNSEAEEYIWIPVDKALSLPIEQYSAKTIRKYLQNRKKI